MRLTAELIAKRPQFINPLMERELDLRGQRIPAIENLSATQDQFDAIDLSNNDVQKLESVTVLRRLKMLLFANNKLSRVADGVGASFPALQYLVLTNNDFAKLSDLDPLASLASLRALALTDNAVTKLAGYRSYVLHLLPALRSLDFQKVKPQEVKAAVEQFGSVVTNGRGPSKPPAERADGAGAKRPRSGAPAAAADAAADSAPPAPKAAKAAERALLPPELVAAAREALASADSLEEVQRLETALKARNADALRAALRARAGAPAGADGGADGGS
ncbi:hypothetical protein KFE25_012801 [Diacronema lutheri]|uniref:U2A'/phosphoprotein 32 family A C-terminal domain-containing protein n=1 Tax=Diacronema lutheri TaxID=2081491 RepID=A0A8J5X6K0_DIALT|nr:hypothetical protein KFE25_012801 [Diacronema lutheri]